MALGVTAALLAASPAEGQDSTDSIQNQVGKCVVELMDRGSSKWEARIICWLSDDFDITKLPGWEICILPNKPKLVANMTEVPEKEKDEKQEEEQPSDDFQTNIPVS